MNARIDGETYLGSTAEVRLEITLDAGTCPREQFGEIAQAVGQATSGKRSKWFPYCVNMIVVVHAKAPARPGDQDMILNAVCHGCGVITSAICWTTPK